MTDASPEAGSYAPVAGFYDLIRPDAAPWLAFYGSLLADRPGSLLDIACGSGIITGHLARCLAAANPGGPAPRVVGIDGSAAMIAAARARDPGIDWIEGDMRALPAIAPVDLAVCCYNSLQHLDATGLGQALRSIRGVLVPGGRLAFDIYNPNFDYLRQTRTDVPTRVVAGPGGRALTIREDARLDEAAGILHLVWRLVPVDAPDGPPLASIAHRIWQHRPETVEAALAAAGFRIAARHGDLDGRPFGPGAKKQVLVCLAA
jgi:SAM-dependent methyltransferase